MLRKSVDHPAFRRQHTINITRTSLLIATALLCAATVRLHAANPDKEAEQLLSQMTLDEKIGQMTQADMLALKTRGDVQKYYLGSVLSGGSSDPVNGNSPASWANAVQAFRSQALQTRLKIPLLYGID